MKVLVSIHIPQVGIDLLVQQPKLEVTVWDQPLPMNREELIRQSKEHDILLSTSGYKIDKDFLEACPHMQLISQFSAGYDNVDVQELNRRSIPFANAPNAMNNATADIAFGLMLAVSRNMFFMHNKIARGEWGAFHPRANLGFEPKGKTMGIFGLGRIGLEMAKRCRGAYDMKIYYHNRTRNKEAEREVGAQYVSFDELLAISDVVSVHCALTNETAGIFNKEVFEKMKPSGIFINTARGSIHNEADLIAALENKEIWGAGLDVTNPEPMKKDNPLLFMENVCVLPHVGSATIKARDEMARQAALNIIQFIQGEPIKNQVHG